MLPDTEVEFVERPNELVHTMSWSGEVPPQNWMNFYTRVLSKFVPGSELRLSVKVEVIRADGISHKHLEETRAALKDQGLNDTLN